MIDDEGTTLPQSRSPPADTAFKDDLAPSCPPRRDRQARSSTVQPHHCRRRTPRGAALESAPQTPRRYRHPAGQVDARRTGRPTPDPSHAGGGMPRRRGHASQPACRKHAAHAPRPLATPASSGRRVDAMRRLLRRSTATSVPGGQNAVTPIFRIRVPIGHLYTGT